MRRLFPPLPEAHVRGARLSVGRASATTAAIAAIVLSTTARSAATTAVIATAAASSASVETAVTDTLARRAAVAAAVNQPMASRFTIPSAAQPASATGPASVLRSSTTAASSPAGGAAATAATGCKAAAAPAAPRKAAGAEVACAAFAAPSTSDQNAVKQFATAFSHVGSTAATVSVAIDTGVAAISAAVETAAGSGSVAADVHHEPLARCDRDNGINTSAIGFGGTRPVSPESNDRDVRHARRHFEILRSAGVVKRLLVRKRVRGIARHDAVTSLAAARCKHGDSYATAKRVATKNRNFHHDYLLARERSAA
jgi:hypothetical protein